MAHYAKVLNGKVVNVIVAEPDFFNTFVDTSTGEWLKTSFNIKGGVYYDAATNQPAADQSIINDDEGRQRKNFAGIDYIYDATRNAFYEKQPFASWTLSDGCIWESPIAYPTDGKSYIWNEDAYQADNTTGWVEVTND